MKDEEHDERYVGDFAGGGAVNVKTEVDGSVLESASRVEERGEDGPADDLARVLEREPDGEVPTSFLVFTVPHSLITYYRVDEEKRTGRRGRSHPRSPSRVPRTGRRSPRRTGRATRCRTCCSGLSIRVSKAYYCQPVRELTKRRAVRRPPQRTEDQGALDANLVDDYRSERAEESHETENNRVGATGKIVSGLAQERAENGGT